jgi:hypothetical protein
MYGVWTDWITSMSILTGATSELFDAMLLAAVVLAALMS